MGCLNSQAFEREPLPGVTASTRLAQRIIDDCFGYIGVPNLALERAAMARRLRPSQ